MKRKAQNTEFLEEKRIKLTESGDQQITVFCLQLTDIVNMSSTYIFEKIAIGLDTRSIAALGGTCKLLRDKAIGVLQERLDREQNLIEKDCTGPLESNRIGYGSPYDNKGQDKTSPKGWRLGQKRHCKQWYYWRMIRKICQRTESIDPEETISLFLRLEYDANKNQHANVQQVFGAVNKYFSRTKIFKSTDHEVSWMDKKILVKELAKSTGDDGEFWNALGADETKYDPIDAVIVRDWIFIRAQIKNTEIMYPEIIMVNLYSQDHTRYCTDNMIDRIKQAIANRSALRRINAFPEEYNPITWGFERPNMPKILGKKNSGRRVTEDLITRTSFSVNNENTFITFNASCRWSIEATGKDTTPTLLYQKSRVNWIITRDHNGTRYGP